MENLWQSKCGPMWQQFPPPVAASSHDFQAQFSNADCRLYSQPPQESVSLTRGMIQDHMVPKMHSLNNLGHADLGASFLSLLSGPLAHVPCDLKQLLDPKPVPISSQVSLNNRTANDFSAGSRVSVLPSALWPHNMDCLNLIPGEVFSPLVSSNSAVSCSNEPAVLEATNLNFWKSQAVACQNSHEKDKATGFSHLVVNNNVSPISAINWKLQNYADMTALQKVPVESNLPACHHGHNPYGSFPRVFCSGTSGNLLLSDTGLLGVVCACHGLYMSISKFSEHSGSSDVNPGNAVRMDNGETIAHWWKAFFSKSGIRVLEGHRGWDWPEGIAAASGLTNRPISNMLSNNTPLNQVCPFRTSASYGQQQYCVINSKENRSSRDILDERTYHEKDRTSQEYSNSLFKHIINISHKNLQHVANPHILEMPNSFGVNTENAYQSATAKLDSICGTENPLLALSNVQDLKTAHNGYNVGQNTSFIVEGSRVSSSIELRLGLPPEQSQTSEAKTLPAFGCNTYGMHVEPSKVLAPEKLLPKTGNELQRSKWSLQYADTTSNPTERRGSTQLEHSSHVGGAYGAITDYRVDSSNSNFEMTDLNLLLLSCFKNPETNWQFRNTYDNGSYIPVSEKMHYESQASKSEKNCFPWSIGAGKIKEFDANISNSQNHMIKGKEVEGAGNGLLGAGKSNVEFSKTGKEGLSTFNVVLGESSFNHSPAFHEKSPNLYQMPSTIADESHGRDILNSCWKISSLFDTRHFNHDQIKPIQNSTNSKETISMEFTSKNSVFVQSGTPTFSKEKRSGISPGLQDENMKMAAAWNMLELSNRDNGPASVRNVQEREILKNPCPESLLTITPSLSKDIHLLDSSRTPKVPEVGDKSTSPGTICWTGHNIERLGTMTGRSLHPADCDLPPVEQLFVRTGGTECNSTYSKEEPCSQGLPYTFVHEKCSCILQTNCLTGKYGPNGDCSCNFVKEGDRCGASTSLFHSKLNENCNFLKERAESVEKNEDLVSPKIKRTESHSFHWRNVRKRRMEGCSSMREEQHAGSFNASLESPAAEVAKCSTGFARNFVPLKEHEISNLSSGCSAPDVIQSSIEVNKKDSSAVEGGDVRCASNLVLDEDSGNDGSWSSDDALCNEHCAEFSGSAARINLIKREPFKVAPRKPSLSLIEEIRLQNSLRCKNAPYEIKRSSTIQEESDHLRAVDVGSRKQRKTVKWMKLDAPFPVSGQSSVNEKSPKCIEKVVQNADSFWHMQMQVGCDQGNPRSCSDSVEQSVNQMSSSFSVAKGISLRRDLHKAYHQGAQQTTEAHKSPRADDTLEASEIVRKKRPRLDDTSAMRKEIQDMHCRSAELTSKLTSFGCPINSLGKPNLYKWMAKPVVSGKYGIISNGNPSKPTKMIPLTKILKTSASHAKKSSSNDKLKSTSVKVKKTSIRHVKETSLSGKVLRSQVRNGGSYGVLPIALQPQDTNGETETASCSATNRSDDLSHTLQKCNNCGIADSKPGVQLKTKFKEGRKRSLHELLTKENSFKVVNSTVMKNPISLCQTTSRYWGELMKDAADGRGQTNEMIKAKRCSEKRQQGNSDTFCSVCGSSDKDECNQLVECSKFLIKGLRSEPEAVDNQNVRFYGRWMPSATSRMFIPNGDGGDSESLQPGEKFVTCARTEGYKGRKREGFLHNHHQDRNASCLVPQEQLNAWLHIHRQKPQRKGHPKLPSSNVESDCRKAYTRYKQSKGWKHLVVYKSGIHALGLYTSEFISRGAMVVEYVGEIVGLRVADRRESEYHSGKKLQHKSACYFFRIDKEHIIDATRKGGIARFVNHSCQPNCVAKVISVRNEKKVVFFAERDIYPGEEITYDYHFNHEDEGEKIPCYCNTKNCRRYLN